MKLPYNFQCPLLLSLVWDGFSGRISILFTITYLFVLLLAFGLRLLSS